MSQHTPQQNNAIHEPTSNRNDSAFIDTVPGDPPVPITVWRTARTDTDLHLSIPARLAYRLVAAYSRPGDTVLDLTTDFALGAACTVGRRTHHRAWFTDHASLTIAAATEPATDTGHDHLAAEAPDVVAWFGDDLIEPSTPTNTPKPAPAGSLYSAASLVVACWPLGQGGAASLARLARLLTTCVALLGPGGCLILIVAVPSGTRATPEDFGPVVAATHQAGLGYLQHIVTVSADTDGDAFVYHAADEELLTLAHTNPDQPPAAHLHVHADLLIFTMSDTSRSNSSHTGSSRRGGGSRG